MHIRQDTIYISGGVVEGDKDKFVALMNKAIGEGKKITTLVVRNSSGGSALEGYGINQSIKTYGLNTVLSGHCYSACADIYLAGKERAFANDLPYDDQKIGIHAAFDPETNIIDTDLADAFYQLNLDDLGGPTKTDPALLRLGYYEIKDPDGMVYYPDPLGNTQWVYFNESGNTLPQDTKHYPGKDIYNNNIVTQRERLLLNDLLVVDKSMAGNINPNYQRNNATNTEDAYGVIHLVNNATWTLNTQASADVLWAKQGRLYLQGGELNTAENIISSAATIQGYGALGNANFATDTVLRGSMIVENSGLDIYGSFIAQPNSELHFTVSNEIEQAPLRFHEVNNDDDDQVVANLGARVMVDVQPGYYKPDSEIPLISSESTLHSVALKYYRLSDLEQQNIENFQPVEGSLLSFRSRLNDKNLSLVANNPFVREELCVNGNCDFQQTLSAIADNTDTDQPMADVLAKVQFTPVSSLSKTLSSLQGTVFADQRLVTAHINRVTMQAINAQIDNQSMDYQEKEHSSWVTLVGNYGRINSNGYNTGLDYTYEGIVLGKDWSVSDNWDIGGALAYMNTDTDGKDFSGEDDAYGISVYSRYDYGIGYFNTNVGYQYSRTETTRNVQLLNYKAKNEGKINGNLFSLYAENGLKYNPGMGIEWQTIIPVLDIAYMPGEQFSEGGNKSTALKISYDDYFSARLGAGFQLSKTFEIGEESALTPRVRVLYQRELANDNAGYNGAFRGAGYASFNHSGTSVGRDILQVSTGLTANLTKSINLSLEYRGGWSENQRDNAIMMTIGGSFQ
ncbi:autotransporter domain-containing protein [Budvicia diplopodorum]|uniref:autotransporter domain-containing protein n=1 Tax=Budvicia diplopodorum TaxID=1119056 RepID=UPI001356BE5F|nr:autotransporter domain-containing protein [Budvicia diplopodorum]